jgi:hypothetical protein
MKLLREVDSDGQAMKKDDSENRRVKMVRFPHPWVRRDVSTLRVIARCVTANISGAAGDSTNEQSIRRLSR